MNHILMRAVAYCSYFFAFDKFLYQFRQLIISKKYFEIMLINSIIHKGLCLLQVQYSPDNLVQ